MNVIFLDFDGVINTPKTWGKRPPIKAIESELVKNVELLAAEFDAKVVISSTWRQLFDLETELKPWLKFHGMNPDRVIGITPFLRTLRSQEIQFWLDSHTGEVEQFVILDDDPGAEIPGHYIRTLENYGFEKVLIRIAREILSGKLQ